MLEPAQEGAVTAVFIPWHTRLLPWLTENTWVAIPPTRMRSSLPLRPRRLDSNRCPVCRPVGGSACASAEPLSTRIYIHERVVAGVDVGLVGEEQRRPAQRITREEAPDGWVVGAHAHPVQPRLGIVAHPILAVVAVGVRPPVGEALGH